MAFDGPSVVDNRDAQGMYEYLEARIEVMKRRIAELEAENERLRSTLHGTGVITQASL
jgi:hypothetical protein